MGRDFVIFSKQPLFTLAAALLRRMPLMVARSLDMDPHGVGHPRLDRQQYVNFPASYQTPRHQHVDLVQPFEVRMHPGKADRCISTTNRG